MAIFGFGKQTPAPGDEPADRPGLLDRLKAGLAKTARVLGTDVRDLFKREGRLVDEAFLEELRAALVRTDMGPKAAEAIESGSGSLTDLLEIESKARNALTKDGFEVDYFSIVSINTLHKPSISESDLVVMGAATLGRARLIDNKRCTRL
jgi:signal recognition particle GTPase